MHCGFCVSTLTNSVGTLLVDWLAKPLKRQLDYLHHFHENVEKFTEQKEQLAMARARLQHEVNEARNQLLEIEDDVWGLLSKAVYTLTNVKSIEQELARNKRCFDPCPNWWCRYRLSKKLTKENLVISELLRKTSKFGELGRVGYRSTSTIPTIQFLSSKDFKASKASEEAFRQIFEAFRDDNVNMIGLWGMGGSGKTTLVREVGTEARKLNLFHKVVITTVSKKPNFKAIQDEIAKFIDFDMNSGQSRRSEQELWLRLQKEKNILVILDDVWAEINLKEKIGIPTGEDHKGCKVLLTTRLIQVCRSMKCQRKVQLSCLDDDEAWALFEMKAGLESSNDAIKKVAAQVVQKCKGLPIAIVTLGSALRDNTNLDMWEATYRRLKTRRLSDIQDINEENAYVCLEASFDYLKDMGTKMCFLLCSLFPEDYEIYVEDLVRFAWGLEFYKSVNSIKELRSEVAAAVEILKNSCLLLDSGERQVKMHDMVRDVALWIASDKKEFSFSIKSEAIETSLENESFQPYAAIFLRNSQIDDLPKALISPNLKILLLLEDDGREVVIDVCFLKEDRLKASEAFHFQTNLKTLRLENCRLVDISILGKLTNLRTLHLERCSLPIISIVGKLKTLEVLSFSWSNLKELPEEIGELNHLKLLDLSYCQSLERIPPNLMQRLPQLEELYLDHCKSLKWATGNVIEEERFSNISEFNALPKLTTLSLEVAPSNIPEDFVFPRLQRYGVCTKEEVKGTFAYWRKGVQNLPIRRSLIIDASMINACKQLFGDVEFLNLKFLAGHQNLVPRLALELDQWGFNKLTSLHLESCKDVKCLVDTTGQHAPTAVFSNLVSLSLAKLHGLEELCIGHQPQGFLQKLETLQLVNCKEMKGGIPILQNLEMLEVTGCEKIQDLFETIELGSTENLSLKCLEFVEIGSCDKLRYIFPATVTNSLGQLKALKIDDCREMEEIIQETEVLNISLQSLRKVDVKKCHKLTSLSSLSYGHVLENLEEICIYNCCRLEYTFPNSMADGLPQLKKINLWELPQLKGRDGNDIVLTLPSLRVLEVGHCPQLTPFTILAKIQELIFSDIGESKQSNNMMVPELRGRAPNMEYLTITNFEDHLFDAVSYNLSHLKELSLWDLPELRVIWKGSIQVANLQNLTGFRVSRCGRLKYIFTATIARNLPQLRTLTVRNCDRLEQIIEKVETLSQDHQPIYFLNLTHIFIKGCANLKSLFPACVVHTLPKLKYLVLFKVSKLEKVFDEGDEVDVSNDKEKVIHLPQLECLRLHQLPDLKSFSPMSYHFLLPSLHDLYVTSCPNIITRFSVDSKQCGHAITETIPSIDENLEEESATTQETTWPIGSEINYERS